MGFLSPRRAPEPTDDPLQYTAGLICHASRSDEYICIAWMSITAVTVAVALAKTKTLRPLDAHHPCGRLLVHALFFCPGSSFDRGRPRMSLMPSQTTLCGYIFNRKSK